MTSDNQLNFFTSQISDDVTTLALHCKTLTERGAIFVNVSNGHVINRKWKCSPEHVTGWEDTTFDDSMWSHAQVIHSDVLNGSGIGNVIWSNGNNSLCGDKQVYCRYTST